MNGHAQGTHIFLPYDNLLQTTKAINVRNDTRINKYMNTFMCLISL
jgi:hypothetical protein